MTKRLIEPEDLIYDVIRPTLKTMDGNYWSPAAERLLFMTAAHESGGFKYRRQIAGYKADGSIIPGVARSLWQIEPATYRDLWDTYLTAVAPQRGALMKRLMQLLLTERERVDPLAALETNDYWACAVARMIYARVPAPLPKVYQAAKLGAYAKEHWNTKLGAATSEVYVHDAETHGPVCNPDEWRLR